MNWFNNNIGGVKFAQLMGLGEHLTIYLHTMVNALEN